MGEGVEVGADVVGVDEVVGVRLGEDGEGVGMNMLGIGGASEFGSVKKGTKITVPKLKSFLKSWIVWFIAWVSAVPHQL